MRALLLLLVAATAVHPASLKVLRADQAAAIAPEVGAGNVVVVHYWAQWCGACLKEWPRLAPALKELGRDVRVATVSLDPKAKASELPAVLARFGAGGWPAYLLDAPEPDPVVAAIDKTWDGSLPATFVYDRQGRRVASLIGTTDLHLLRAAVAQAEAAK